MKKLLIAATALTGLAATPAMAETVPIVGVVADFCNVGISQVTSGTMSVAEPGFQTVANLLLKCNSSGGVKLTVDPIEGDLVQMKNNVALRINYDMELISPVDDFDIGPADTSPASYNEVNNSGNARGSIFNRQTNLFDKDVAKGIALVLRLNTNVNVDSNNTPTSQNFEATAAPGGTYKETFTFTVTPL